MQCQSGETKATALACADAAPGYRSTMTSTGLRTAPDTVTYAYLHKLHIWVRCITV